MKEDLERIFLMGLGAMSMTTEKAKELKDELLKKGEEAYQNGKELNEELKHNFAEKVKDSVTVVVEKPEMSKEDIFAEVSKMSDEDKKELMKLLKEKKEKNNEQ